MYPDINNCIIWGITVVPYSDNIWRKAFFYKCNNLPWSRCEMIAVLQMKVESRGLVEHTLSWCQPAVSTAWGWRHRGAPWHSCSICTHAMRVTSTLLPYQKLVNTLHYVWRCRWDTKAGRPKANSKFMAPLWNCVFRDVNGTQTFTAIACDLIMVFYA